MFKWTSLENGHAYYCDDANPLCVASLMHVIYCPNSGTGVLMHLYIFFDENVTGMYSNWQTVEGFICKSETAKYSNLELFA